MCASKRFLNIFYLAQAISAQGMRPRSEYAASSLHLFFGLALPLVLTYIRILLSRRFGSRPFERALREPLLCAHEHACAHTNTQIHTVVPEEVGTSSNANGGTAFLVYHKTRDFMRGVSKHVSIGAAYKKEKPMGQFFILNRKD